MIIDPKARFIASLGPESRFRNVMRSDEMQNALSFALAELAITSPTQEESKGANKFVSILLNLGEQAPPMGSVPDKRLDYTVLKQPNAETPKTTEKKS